jgi:hypothetical protein
MPGLMQSWFQIKGAPKAPKINVTSAAPAGGGGGASPSGVAPGTTPGQFTADETARYQQMLAGLGMGQEGNQLPQGIQENINRQASLIG